MAEDVNRTIQHLRPVDMDQVRCTRNNLTSNLTIVHTSFYPHCRGQDISINDLPIRKLIEFDQRIDMVNIPSKYLSELRSEESEEIMFKLYQKLAKEEKQLNLMPLE